MEYWRRDMNWPLDKDWKCPICGARNLTWGLSHGECRCDSCHVQFMMREGETILTVPQCTLKSKYFTPFKRLWEGSGRPISTITKEEMNAELDAELVRG